MSQDVSSSHTIVSGEHEVQYSRQQVNRSKVVNDVSGRFILRIRSIKSTLLARKSTICPFKKLFTRKNRSTRRNRQSPRFSTKQRFQLFPFRQCARQPRSRLI